MNDMQQAIRAIESGNVPDEKLKEILKFANDTLAQYEQGLNFLDKVDEDNWTYEAMIEATRLGGGGGFERWRWDQMFPHDRLELRTTLINTIHQGQQVFGELKATVEAELAKGKG